MKLQTDPKVVAKLPEEREAEIWRFRAFLQDWAEMTPAEAGRNAIKMMLYYAIRREMLWPQDLDEIALNGRTANGCRIAGRTGDRA